MCSSDLLEQIDVASDALLSESLLGIHAQPFQDALPRTIVGDQLLHAVAFSGRILRVAAYIEVQPGPVAQEDIAASAPCNHASKQIARYFIGTEPALSPERAGDAVFGFDSEDAAIHVSTVGVSGSLRRGLRALQQVRQGVAFQPVEQTPGSSSVQDGHFEVIRAQRPALVRSVLAKRIHRLT